MGDESIHYLIGEVHNFGGFFGGDTVTFTATERTKPDEERTLTVDERVFVNVRDRHTITSGMLLALMLTGDRVDRAELLGAESHTALRKALGPISVSGPLEHPHYLSYRCDACNLWVAGAPADNTCRVCGQPLEA